MPRARAKFTLETGDTPEPKYASIHDCLQQNIPLLVRMIKAGEEVERRMAKEQAAANKKALRNGK